MEKRTFARVRKWSSLAGILLVCALMFAIIRRGGLREASPLTSTDIAEILACLATGGLYLFSGIRAGPNGPKWRNYFPRSIQFVFNPDETEPALPILIALGISTIVFALLLVTPHLYAAALHLSRIQFALSLTALLLVLGWSAHFFKQKSQYWYGITEVIVAVLFILDRCFQAPPLL